MKNNSALMFTCSLIEYIGRKQKLSRSEVVQRLGRSTIKRIYSYADVLHCEPIASVAEEYIKMAQIKEGDFDNVGKCKYDVPDYWTIGEVYERLIEDVEDVDVEQAIYDVYTSWISDAISNYNTDFYYQPRDYIRECYISNSVIAQ